MNENKELFDKLVDQVMSNSKAIHVHYEIKISSTVSLRIALQEHSPQVYRVVRSIFKYEGIAPASWQNMPMAMLEEKVLKLNEKLRQKFGPKIFCHTKSNIRTKFVGTPDETLIKTRKLIIERHFDERLIDRQHAELLAKELHEFLAPWRRTLL